MRNYISSFVLLYGLLTCLAGPLPAAAQQPAAGLQKNDDAMEVSSRDSAARYTERKVLHALASKKIWDGPTTGPRAQPDKSLIFIAADMKNGGIAGVLKGVEEATKAIGW